MNNLDLTTSTLARHEAVAAAVDIACSRITPSWPLDESIAVNPYWGFVGHPMHEAAKHIETYSGSRMCMPRSFYRRQWQAGVISATHLTQALKRSDANLSVGDLEQAMEVEAPATPRVPLMTTFADAQRDLLHNMSLDDFVRHSISQHCASYFDQIQSSWNGSNCDGLYQSWLRHASHDRSPRLLLGMADTREFARSLPQEALATIIQALQTLPLHEEEWADYLTALLMNIHGWASWCAFERWQAALRQDNNDHILHLLAIRLAWEQFIFSHVLKNHEIDHWRSGWTQLANLDDGFEARSVIDWVLQDALELAYQEPLCRALRRAAVAKVNQPASVPEVQAAFCIDVRSEPLRRALEACSDSIQTLGFPGFFGLPIAYTPIGTESARPQLPGLLAPKLNVTETTGVGPVDQRIGTRTRDALRLKALWKSFRSSPSSMFTFVESFGLLYAGSLVKRTITPLRSCNNEVNPTAASLRPCLTQTGADDAALIETGCDLAFSVLKNMSLTEGFARLIVLTGHGSQSINNPQAAGLNCGACGGHTGEVNARLLASILNTPAIREGLLSRGIAIPNTTHVMAALHNTVTEEVTLFDTASVPPSHASDLGRLKSWLQQAGNRVRMQRAPLQGIDVDATTTEQKLLHRFRAYTQDWSQVRPEWGLANNAAFLIAPRHISRGLDLEGRVFLHEYRSEFDPDGTVLESIMTAPMLVTNWINMQYYASTVDNQQYGSGNKVLHNVVGGRIGVFEGNGGDLRIGLPIQSLHDGQQLRHTPLRLSVFIQAPQSGIEAVIAKHKVVSDLVHHAWLHLFQISPHSGEISRYQRGVWEPCETNDRNTAASEDLVGGALYA